MKIYIILMLILSVCLLIRQIYLLYRYPAVVAVSWKQIVGQLEKSQVSLNREKSRLVFLQDPTLLGYFETTTSVLKNLLESISSSKGRIQEDYASMEATAFLAKQITERCQRLSKAVHQQIGQGRYQTDLLYNDLTIDKTSTIGCYFCSRPHHPVHFRYVDVSVSKENHTVMACRVCRHELEGSGEVKVLSFMKNGKASHWTELEGYKPNPKYWNKRPRRKKIKASLKLIKTSDDSRL